MRKLSFCTFALCLGFASVTHADPTVTKYKFKGNTAGGSAWTGDDGCFSASMGVHASDDITKDGSGSTTSQLVEIGYGGRDLCNHLSFGGAKTIPLTIPIANVSTVTFSFDIVIDYANTETDERFQRHLTGTATITATGEFEKSRTSQIVQSQEVRTVTRSKGTTREASFVVDVKLDGVPQTFAITSGEIGTTKSGSMEITRF